MIEHTTSDVFVVLWLVLLFREGTNFILFSSKYIIVCTNFQLIKLYSF